MSKLVNMHGWNAERRIDGIRDFVKQLADIAQEKPSQGRQARLRSGLVLLQECLKTPTA